MASTIQEKQVEVDLGEKVDRGFDVLGLEEEKTFQQSGEDSIEDSSIKDVRAAVPPTDNSTLPTSTFRAIYHASLFTLSFNHPLQFFWFRDNPLTIKVLVAQLLAYPAGKFLEHILPTTKFSLFGSEVSLNPGLFNFKEHVLITAMANAASTSFEAIDIIVISKLYYDQDWGFGGGILLVLSTSLIGFGFAGFLRRYLVRPSSMVWPINLVNASLFHTLHREVTPEVEKAEREQGRSISRNMFFVYAFFSSFVWYWFTGYIFPLLTSISWLCLKLRSWTNRNSVLVSQLGSGLNGLGLLSFTLDWSTLAAWLPSPLAIPWVAQANMLAGFVFFCWILVPAVYYTNSFEAQKFPIYNTRQYDIFGQKFNRTRVVIPQENILDETAYQEYSPVRITAFFAIMYGQGLCALGAILSHTILYNGKEVWDRFKSARQNDDDIHAKLMDKYPEVPNWWYLSLFVVAFVLGLVTVIVYPADMPWWTLIIAMILAVAWVLPLGILTAVTSQSPSISMISEWVYGVIRPGHPIGNIIFKTYGYITVRQALTFSQDLKLGHYMKIPPRDMFIFQTVGTIVASFISLGTTTYLMGTIDNICSSTAYPWTCPNAGLFGASSVVWGLVGPSKFFYPGTIYNPIAYFLLWGFLLPIPFYLAYRRWPNSWIKHVSIPVFMLGPGPYPPAPTNVLPTWAFLGFIFNFYIKKNYSAWWVKYNYVLSAALDSGIAVCAIVMFFALQNNIIFFPAWWGNNVSSIDQCPLATANWTGTDVYA
ncbi:hypothetical protein BC936DRAFT_140927 [Jimgerdemannia flammicorona]|uniref:OPT family small oligopeptide transporter n=1 Tax=Jimgerdemannia flammicorona TaxID=994334 RepID=A0A433DGH4_9FUNG|nr:hypothetical protein BC936DRAFT_140927 [Jimgerdemannia flammicorona]